ncbi:MAG: histidine kinase, partial [Cyanobacteriota bacterium]|nr:histidine kinase [Cyanobacteriota bacterium]
MVFHVKHLTLERLWQHLPLRAVLIVPFVVQIVGTVGLVGYFSFRNSQKAVTDLGDRMMEETSDRIVQSLKTYTAIPHTINQINADALRLGQLDLQDFRAIERHLWYQIQNFNSVTYIQLANEGGQFV